MHDSKTVRPVIGQDLVDGIAVFDGRSLMHRLRSTLVAAADHEQVGMLTEALVPHLLWSVAAVTVTFLPLHAAFGSVEVVLSFFWLTSWAEPHVRCYERSPV